MVDTTQTRLFVLDTNVLMHDPTAIFRFQEHDVFLPMVVLEELDGEKKGVSEVARNARQITRFLDQLLLGTSKADIDVGLPLNSCLIKNTDNSILPPQGRLFFQTPVFPPSLPETGLRDTPDNKILAITLALQQHLPERQVILISKDINLRIKAALLGAHAEDYSNDRALEDVNLLYSGILALPADFWNTHSKEIYATKGIGGRTFFRIKGPEVVNWYLNQCIYAVNEKNEENFEAIVRNKEYSDVAIVELARNYRAPHPGVWNIVARNLEQNFALNLLLNPDIDFVSLVGTAGTGKTLLALAAGLNQVLDTNRYQEIIMTRATVAVGEDIGFLPGTEEEKMTPWMGALMDNLEVLIQRNDNSEWSKAATAELIRKRVHIRSLAFMRGRTFLNKYLILDEAQNLTSKQMKALITRAGPGTKVICMGNVNQIDTPYLTETTSGLTYAVDRFRYWEHSGHITLLRGERSRLADFASEAL